MHEVQLSLVCYYLRRLLVLRHIWSWMERRLFESAYALLQSSAYSLTSFDCLGHVKHVRESCCKPFCDAVKTRKSSTPIIITYDVFV